MPPTPAGNPSYPLSLFPNAVDSLSNQPDPETAQAIMAIESSLIGGASGGAPSAPGLSTLSAASMAVGGVTILGGSGVPAAGLGANGNSYFRLDGAASAHIYFKAAGAWTALV